MYRKQYVEHLRRRVSALLVFALTMLSACATTSHESRLQIAQRIETYNDGRKSIQELYAAYLTLLERGWTMQIIVQSQPAGTTDALPIVAFRSPRAGPAVWLLAGIHGEEPAGPNAISLAIDDIAAFGEHHAAVLLPLLNPHGYARNWRYLNTPVYSASVDGASVGDSSHVLPESAQASVARAAAASSDEAGALIEYIATTMQTYPPSHSIDLHEDNLIDAGYVYSQGELGAGDPLSIEAVATLRESNIPIKMDGETRFGESIVNGIVGPVIDSSVDELMSSNEILIDGQRVKGPGAKTVLVVETSAGNTALSRRIEAQMTLVRRLLALIASSTQ